MYAMICTRPDIAYAVGVVSKYMSNPGKKHWEAVKGVMRYLNGTKELCICFGRKEACVLGYTDADYAGIWIRGGLLQVMSSFLLEVLFLGDLVCRIARPCQPLKLSILQHLRHARSYMACSTSGRLGDF